METRHGLAFDNLRRSLKQALLHHACEELLVVLRAFMPVQRLLRFVPGLSISTRHIHSWPNCLPLNKRDFHTLFGAGFVHFELQGAGFILFDPFDGFGGHLFELVACKSAQRFSIRQR